MHRERQKAFDKRSEGIVHRPSTDMERAAKEIFPSRLSLAVLVTYPISSLAR